MEKYKIRFFFDYGGPCFWCASDRAYEKWGYPIEIEQLPLSDDLKRELNDLDREYRSYFNIEYLPDPLSWTKEQEVRFIAKTNTIYERVKNELGEEYEVVNEFFE